MRPFEEKVQDQLCTVLTIAVIVAFAAAFFQRFTGKYLTNLWGECVLLERYQIYCPGCGGTRAIKALFRGHFIKSFWYHPFVIYAVLIAGLFLGSSGMYGMGLIKSRFLLRPVYFYLGIVIILGQFILKNIGLWVFP